MMASVTQTQTPAELLARLRDLRAAVREEGGAAYDRWGKQIERRAFRLSACNLAYYLAFRTRDLRDLQAPLSMLGLSSLGRAEARVLPNLDAVIASLARIAGEKKPPAYPSARAFTRGERLLERATERVFGAEPDGRRVRVMVTYPTEAAEDAALVRSWVERGMDCARINCAHDDEAAWARMIAHTQAAARELGRNVRILMDLGGPKVRTGAVVAPKKRPLQTGDLLLLTRGKPKDDDDDDDDEFPFQAQSQIKEIFDQVEVGHAVWLDDGQVSTLVEAKTGRGLVLRVTQAGADGYKLKPEKGLNFPDTDLQLDALTPDDLKALDFVAQNADMIGYSFVQSAEDVAQLQDELATRRDDWRKLILIAKIETPRAVRNLPEIVVRAAGRQPFGVMIARGDLAVELGFERMAEMQEEILWLCEAAHVPVIWATQVLEKFVKKGTLSRAEMTDAAMSARAECVMLNKGPFVGDAIGILDDVLRRMAGHQDKKTPRLRALRAWAET